MSGLLISLHVIICLALILIVLLQAGKGADLGAAFGGGSSQTAFGARRGNVLTKFTTICAVLFMITSFLLTFYYSRPSGRLDLIPKETPEATQETKEETREEEKGETE